MARGGKRPGAGRKKGFSAITAEESRKVIADLVAKDIAPITKALIKKAKQGDVKAANLLFDRVYGRPINQEDQKATKGDIAWYLGQKAKEARIKYAAGRVG